MKRKGLAAGLVLVCCSLVATGASAPPYSAASLIKVRVLVVEINPLIPGAHFRVPDPSAAAKPLNEAAGWNDPHALADAYRKDVEEASGGRVEFEIVQWMTVREFPAKVDGFVDTAASYMASLRDPKAHPWHKPDGVDYPRLVRRLDLVRRVESGEIDDHPAPCTVHPALRATVFPALPPRRPTPFAAG